MEGAARPLDFRFFSLTGRVPPSVWRGPTSNHPQQLRCGLRRVTAELEQLSGPGCHHGGFSCHGVHMSPVQESRQVLDDNLLAPPPPPPPLPPNNPCCPRGLHSCFNKMQQLRTNTCYVVDGQASQHGCARLSVCPLPSQCPPHLYTLPCTARSLPQLVTVLILRPEGSAFLLVL